MVSRFLKAILRAAAGLAFASCLASAGNVGQTDLDSAYKALAAKHYDLAVTLFRRGLSGQPSNGSAHKDLAYTLLKTGDNAEARDEFAAAMRLNPADETASLEFAFLAFETQQPVEARRTFDRLRKRGGAATRATAETAFQNIDKPLAAGIARWQQALARASNPNDPALFSAHWELAQLAEQRDELELAAAQYAICRLAKPERVDILLDQARIWQQLNRVEEAHAALLLASRCTQSRTAEIAAARLGERYPYPYEFLNALKLDGRNTVLRRELAFLYLAMGKQPEALEQFRQVLQIDANDRTAREQLDALTGVRKPPPMEPLVTSAASEAGAKAMGLKSFALGYSRDAIKYLRQAHDEDPDDAEILLKLGYAYNYAKDDFDALKWLDLARQAADPAIADEAKRAYRNLSGDVPAQTTVWTLPMYSSRWHDVFEYGQIKRTVPLPKGLNRWLSLYGSARFSGDWKSSMPQAPTNPQYLSDSSVIFGVGVATRTWHHLTAWAEGGESVQYLPFRHDAGGAVPDYRGGLSFAKTLGTSLGSSGHGWVYETTADAVYVSRYDKDWIFTNQNRVGWTLGRYQLLWNINAGHDLKNQYWAETVETGPGLRLHLPWWRPNVYLSADFLRGAYTNNIGNPRPPNYSDVRVGFWYAATR